MATTKTERAIALLNYGAVTRLNSNPSGRIDSFPNALKDIVDIFGNRVKSGTLTPEEIADFQAHVDLVDVLDNHNLYPGIDNIPYYCDNMLKECTYTNGAKRLG